MHACSAFIFIYLFIYFFFFVFFFSIQFNDPFKIILTHIIRRFNREVGQN